MSRVRVARALGVLVGLLASCAPGPSAVAEVPGDVGPVTEDPEVAVLDNRFEPDEVVVEAGTAVRWSWEGRAAHDVVGDGFDSGIQATGTFSHTFAAPGAYAYVCTLHPGMEADVFVVPPSGDD